MKKSLEDQINDALDFWEYKKQIAFLQDVIPLFELYDVEDESDWVKNAVGEDNEMNVRLIRTVYLISKIAEKHAGALASFKMRFPNLYKKMENV
jgi:hypothetical protein